MEILLVEDDEDKRQQLIAFIKKTLTCTIFEARSLQSGTKALLNKSFDLVILDMSMPTFDITPTDTGGRPQPYGGKEILNQIDRRGINTKVIVVTQFDKFGASGEELTINELNSQLIKQFPSQYIGAVYYSVRYSNWQDNLKELLLKYS